MQVSEMIKFSGPPKVAGETVSTLKKETCSFEKLLRHFSQSVADEINDQGSASLASHPEEELVNGYEELFQSQEGQSKESQEDQLGELLAMMGQNAPGALEQIKMYDGKKLELEGPIAKSGRGQEELMVVIKTENLNKAINGEGLMTSQQEKSLLNPEKAILMDQSQMDDLLAKDIPKNIQAKAEKSDVVDLERTKAVKDGSQVRRPQEVIANQDDQKSMDVKAIEIAEKESSYAKRPAEITSRQDASKNIEANVKVASIAAKEDKQVKRPQEVIPRQGRKESMAIKATEFKVLLKDQKASVNNRLDSSNMIDMAKTGPIGGIGTSEAPDEVPLAKQIEGKILGQFDGKTDKVFKMTLNPENLGEIEVELKVNHGKLIIGILSASQETHDLLTRQLDQLIRGLTLQKIQVETVQIHRFVEETKNSQGQANFNNMDFNQHQSDHADTKNKQRYQRQVGSEQTESLSESVAQLRNVNKQFNRLDYRI